MAEVVMRQRFDAAPTRVFALLTDHLALERYMDGARVTIEREGVPPPNGFGAVRKVTARGIPVWEEVVRFEEPTAMDYRVVRGGPLRDHLGCIRIEPTADGGVDVDYRIRFRVPWYFGGGLVAAWIARELRTAITAGLARMARDLSDVRRRGPES